MSLKDHYSPEKFRSVVVKLSDLYNRHRLTDVEVTSQLLDYLGSNPEMVAEMFNGLCAGVQNALVELVEDGDEAWYSGYFSPCTCPGQVVKTVTINDSTSPSTVSLQILRGKNELEELTVDPEHPARVAIETLRAHLQTIGRLKQK